MDLRIQLFAAGASALLLFVIFELVRSRRLMERYALLWLFSGLVILGLAIWRNVLEVVAKAIGVFYPPSALFIVAFGFVLLLLLHFSVVVSRLSDQNKLLSQRLALLEEQATRSHDRGTTAG
jgi:hypothetical protein